MGEGGSRARKRLHEQKKEQASQPHPCTSPLLPPLRPPCCPPPRAHTLTASSLGDSVGSPAREGACKSPSSPASAIGSSGSAGPASQPAAGNAAITCRPRHRRPLAAAGRVGSSVPPVRGEATPPKALTGGCWGVWELGARCGAACLNRGGPPSMAAGQARPPTPSLALPQAAATGAGDGGCGPVFGVSAAGEQVNRRRRRSAAGRRRHAFQPPRCPNPASLHPWHPPPDTHAARYSPGVPGHATLSSCFTHAAGPAAATAAATRGKSGKHGWHAATRRARCTGLST